MKVGDLVRIKLNHWSQRGEYGIIIEDPFPHHTNKGKAWRILFKDGKIKSKLAKHLEVINEVGS